MARKPMVTRTIKSTKCVVLCANVNTCEMENRVVNLARTYKDEKKLRKALEELINNDELKFVHIVDKEEVETLYGMSEQCFMEHAKELDKDTRKELGEETDTDECEETETVEE